MLIISDSMRSVTANITRVTEIVKSHVSVPNTLGPRDNFGRITKFLPYRQRETGIVQYGREETGRDGNDGASMA
jgi:hypothetical protein